jgi:hypothetical protein
VPTRASLHVQTNDSEAVQHALVRLLEPGFAAYIAFTDRWTSVIAEQLDSFDLEDLKPLAGPLSDFGLTIAFVGHENLEVWRFPSAQHERISNDELEPRAASFGIPLEHITNFEALEETPVEGFVRLEQEPEKPGLKEFFGRSEDE